MYEGMKTAPDTWSRGGWRTGVLNKYVS